MKEFSVYGSVLAGKSKMKYFPIPKRNCIRTNLNYNKKLNKMENKK